MVGTDAAVRVLFPGLLGVSGAATACGLVPATLVLKGFGGGTSEAGVRAGVGGPEDDGDGSSTIHIRCERVATSFATVWARVDKGLTWKTGYGSLPSFIPRSERMTEMKCMQEERRRGREAVDVRSYTQSAEVVSEGVETYASVDVRDVSDHIGLIVEDG